jgi:hypothetical protein
LATYLIGQRADAYFRLGPEAVGSWTDSLRTISGIDERNIANILSNGSKATGTAIVSGASRVGETGKAARGAIAESTGKVAETVGPALTTGAQSAGQAANKGLRAYVRWLVRFWTSIFGFMGRLIGLLWLVISFIPRQIFFRK